MLQSIDSPIATDSITNKPATQKASLYHLCRSVLDGLAAVPGFEPYLDLNPPTDADDIAPQSACLANDPLSKLWHICRQGSSLCLLYNTLRPDDAIAQGTGLGNMASKPKACIYHFILACRDKLHFSEDSLFTVTDLYQNDTNGFVKVVNTLKRILDLLEHEGIISIRSSNRNSDPNAPKDKRDKVVFEFLETERKYVQDLEALQDYMREAQAQNVLPPDTLHNLFGNLNSLVDFQRRFCIQIEQMADQAPQDQRFGNLFIQLEDAFAVYEPFCANLSTAQDLVIQETVKLQKLADIMSPTYELPSMLIKPVQRVCRYPLLMQQLVKATPEDWKYSEEMKEGLEAIQRVAGKVNETNRRQENVQKVEDLKKRIEDWKGSIDHFGQLLLEDKFMLYINNAGREMLVFLFEKTLLVCKEDKEPHKKSNAMIIKKKKKEGSLVVRGKILISKIAQVNDTSQNGTWSLHIFWSEKDSQSLSAQYFNLQSFTLKCRNEEQLKQWESTLNRLLQIEKRMSMEHRAAEAQAGRLYHTTSMPHVPRASYQPDFEDTPTMNYDEDEEEEDQHHEDTSDDEVWGRRTSSKVHMNYMRHQRISEGESHRKMSAQAGMSAGLSNGRHYTAMPGMTLPPLRASSNGSSLTDGMVTPAADYSYASSLSYPTSPPTSYPSSPTATNKTSSSSSLASTHGYSPSHRRQMDDTIVPTEMVTRTLLSESVPTPTEEYPGFPCSPPHAATLVTSTSHLKPTIPPGQLHHTRLRSQSSPNIHRPAGATLFDNAPELPPINSRTLYDIKRKSNGDYHEERPSNLQYTAVDDHTKIKVHYLGEIYVVVVSLDISYMELLGKIERKIRSCGQSIEITMGLKYQDEDGDLITIISNEDVQMGLESRGLNNTVNVYVTC
ncbi:uncharacterized protein BYT42DRAFT_616235 [Radiomyces spectabilis]|uniref:uncharacterized protein n=1 Tax=Radiomyces spectabilis TaxID=64574 RepID=UPI00221EB03C|nr:uncharacterized protein BYT42DRAFT_616235 [Radiomyces spectabilis]KAI8373049.1 hypothetical protein BYT42DRAFT_616235 [Radiomyces spectabilis]